MAGIAAVVQEDDDELLDVNDVARWLKTSKQWVRAHATRKRKPYLPCVKLGGTGAPLRFRREHIKAFIEQHSTTLAA